MSGGNKLVKNTIIYALGDIIPRLFSFISFPILTTYLLPADYGIINYVTTINTFLTIIGLLGINTYYLVFYYRVDTEEERRKMLGNLDLFLIIANLLITVLFFLVGPALMKTWGSKVDFFPYMALGITTSFFNVFRYLPSALFRLKENPLPLTILNVLSGLLTMVGSIVAVVYIKADASSVLTTNLVIAIIFAIVFFIITNKNAKWNINLTQIKVALKFSLPLVPGSIAGYLYSTFDRVLIEKYLTLSDVGIYSTSATLALLLNIVTYGAYQAFEPYFFKTFGSTNFSSNFEKVRNTLLCICLIGALALSCFGEEFFRIFSSERYRICYLYVPLIVMGCVASSMSRMYSTVVTAREKTKISAAITIAGAVVSVSMNIILLRHLGIWAAAISYFVTFIFVMCAEIYFANIKIRHARSILSTLFAIICMVVLTYFLRIENIYVSILVKFVLWSLCSLAIVKITECDTRLFMGLLKK